MAAPQHSEPAESGVTYTEGPESPSLTHDNPRVVPTRTKPSVTYSTATSRVSRLGAEDGSDISVSLKSWTR
jgi:hypothetical protein